MSFFDENAIHKKRRNDIRPEPAKRTTFNREGKGMLFGTRNTAVQVGC